MATITALQQALQQAIQGGDTNAIAQAANALNIANGPVINGASTLPVTDATQTTAPSAGGAGALPATPAGYVQVVIAGVNRLLPYY